MFQQHWKLGHFPGRLEITNQWFGIRKRNWYLQENIAGVLLFRFQDIPSHSPLFHTLWSCSVCIGLFWGVLHYGVFPLKSLCFDATHMVSPSILILLSCMWMALFCLVKDPCREWVCYLYIGLAKFQSLWWLGREDIAWSSLCPLLGLWSVIITKAPCVEFAPTAALFPVAVLYFSKPEFSFLVTLECDRISRNFYMLCRGENSLWEWLEVGKHSMGERVKLPIFMLHLCSKSILK